MIQIATTIEQSKRLIEAGIDPNTADMQWNAIPTQHGAEMELFVGEMTPNGLLAWSLSALIQLLPERIPYRIIRIRGKDVEGIFEDIVNFLCKEK